MDIFGPFPEIDVVYAQNDRMAQVAHDVAEPGGGGTRNALYSGNGPGCPVTGAGKGALPDVLS